MKLSPFSAVLIGMVVGAVIALASVFFWVDGKTFDAQTHRLVEDDAAEHDDTYDDDKMDDEDDDSDVDEETSDEEDVSTETESDDRAVLLNTELGVQVSYPAEFVYGIEESRSGDFIQIATYDLDAVYTGSLEYGGVKLEVSRLDQLTPDYELEDAMREVGYDALNDIPADPTTFETLTLGGVPAMESTPASDDTLRLIVVDVDGTFYSVSLVGDQSAYDEMQEELDAMIESMRFVTSDADVPTHTE